MIMKFQNQELKSWLQKRLKLINTDKDFVISDVVQGVIALGDELYGPVKLASGADASGVTYDYTVPVGRRWYIDWIWRSLLNAPALGGVISYYNGSAYITLAQGAAVVNQPIGIELTAGMYIRVTTEAGVSSAWWVRYREQPL